MRSWNERTDEFNLDRLYELAIADPARPESWDQRRYAPDLIVSAIGTNDFNPGIPERATYVGKYVALVRTLLHDHPQARIVLTEGAILDGAKKAALRAYIDETVRQVGDPRVSSVASRHYPGDVLDAHPTREQHAAMAADLVPQLRAVMGW
ncbi:GDSL-type esterase/lipase family protein [Pseudoduganella armeniaca]|uniref:GDSL-type esterase/lipase family protein n=1 Tax=Pseudoduganella armeniaca TaxID=2072590 RepID=UPI0015E77F93